MALVTDKAVTLAVSDYSETSQIVTLMTRNNGRLSAMAKGSKRPKSRFGGPIDKLQAVEAVFTMRPSGGLGQLTEQTLEDDLPGLRRRLDAFYAACYLAELVRLGTEELDPHPEVHDLLRETLSRLSNGYESGILVFSFEVRLLSALGLMPKLDGCVACGRPRPGDAKADRRLFSPVAGGLLCRRCRTDGGQGVDAGDKALDALLFLRTADEEALGRVRLAPKTAADMRRVLRAYWPCVLSREPRAARWLR